jgi:crotonobetaine/carnitine-CoA ligase
VDYPFQVGDSGLLTPGKGTVSRLFHEIAPSERTVAKMIRDAVDDKRGLERPFLSVDGKDRVSFGELVSDIIEWDRVLDEFGVGPGGRVAIMLPNQAEYVSLILSLANSGRVSVPVNTASKGWILRYILEDSEAEMLVAAEEYLERIDVLWELPSLQTIVAVNNLPKGESSRMRAKHWPRALEKSWRVVPLARHWRASTTRRDEPRSSGVVQRMLSRRDVRPTDEASILYTSGTTGPPKGAVMVHENYYFHAWAFSFMFAYSCHDTLFTVLPLFHVNAQCVTILPAIMCNAKVAMYGHFRASRFWDWIADSGATQFAAIGTMGNILLKRPPQEFRTGHKLRVCQIVPAPDSCAEFEERFGVPVVSQLYGMTEGLFVLPSHDVQRRPRCCGKNLPYHDVQIVDDEDREVAVGRAGEIVVRPKLPNILSLAYLGKERATVDSCRNLWFHTGDIGERDAEGNLWFVGRVKDIIRRRGENIASFVIERELLSNAKVLEAVAFGVPSEVGDEEVMVCIVPAGSATCITGEELYLYCKERLPSYMLPRFIEIRPDLPKNSSMRVLKDVLIAEGVSSRTWVAPEGSREAR